jgi:hypothetical protein
MTSLNKETVIEEVVESEDDVDTVCSSAQENESEIESQKKILVL